VGVGPPMRLRLERQATSSQQGFEKGATLSTSLLIFLFPFVFVCARVIRSSEGEITQIVKLLDFFEASLSF
jgi:hypothetical protein